MKFTWIDVVTVVTLVGSVLSLVQDPSWLDCFTYYLAPDKDYIKVACSMGNRTNYWNWTVGNNIAWQEQTPIYLDECVGMDYDGNLVWERNGNLHKRIRDRQCEYDFLHYNQTTDLISLTCGKFTTLRFGANLVNDLYGNVWCNFNESVDTTKPQVHPMFANPNITDLPGVPDWHTPGTFWKHTTIWYNTKYHAYSRPTLTTHVTVSVATSSDTTISQTITNTEEHGKRWYSEGSAIYPTSGTNATFLTSTITAAASSV